MDQPTASRGTHLAARDRRLALGGGWLARLAEARTAAVLDRIDAGLAAGSLDVTLPDGRYRRLGGHTTGPAAAITLANWRPVVRLMLAGSAGFARAHFDGDWASPAPEAIFALFVANRTTLGTAARATGPWRVANRVLRAVDERLHPRRNIEHHYDLGNDFYAAWLDPGMTYSSALFDPECHPRESGDPSPEASQAATALRRGEPQEMGPRFRGDDSMGNDGLEAAQTRKIRALLDAVGLRPGHRLLDIGCGWGGLAEIAARDYGARVHGITLSAEQLAYARARVPEATFALTDYRAAQGQYDVVTSVEMIEAVGERHWPTFMGLVRDRLALGGRAGLQAITIADDVFADYRRSTDFIQAYIFPGGMLPSPSRLRAAATGAGFTIAAERWFGPDYALTLRLWRARFDAAVTDGRLPPGFDDRFVALWRYYLMYCEGGFDGGGLDVGQVVLT